MDARGLLLIAAAVAIAVIGARLERQQQSPTTTGSGGYASQERIGARNHSGIEPYDLFGFRKRGW